MAYARKQVYVICHHTDRRISRSEISKSKNIKNAGCVVGHSKSAGTMSISLPTIMFWLSVKLLSALPWAASTAVELYEAEKIYDFAPVYDKCESCYLDKETGYVCMSWYRGFFCFCLEVLPAEGYSAIFGQGLLCTHKQNLSEYRRMGS